MLLKKASTSLMSTKLIVFGALFAREILRVGSPVSNIIYVPHVRPPRLRWRKCRDIFVGQHMTQHKKKATVRPLPNSLHCRSRTASDMTCKLGTCITFADESKDFYVEKSGQSSCRRAKRSWLVEVRKRFRLDGNCKLRSSLHQYKNIVQKRQLSLPATSTHTREL